MVFSSAEEDSGYTRFMSRVGNRTASTVPSRPLPPKPTNNAPSVAPKPLGTTSTVSTSAVSKQPNITQAANARSNGASAINANTNGVKRKAEEDLSRPNKLQETGKNTTTDKQGATPAEPAKALKKGSYMELLNRAKITPKVPAGAIVNKPKAPVEPMKKEWQKKIQVERAAKAAAGGRTSKSPGVGSGGEKTGVKAGDKGAPSAKRPGTDVAGSSKKGALGPLDRKTSAAGASAASSSSSKAKPGAVDPKARTSAAIKERERSPPARRGSRDDYPRGGRASVYDRPKGYQKRYTYRDDTDSDSDMEATGIDILEEEEFSAKKARLEDLEQERLEKKLAAEKAAKKKSLRR